MQFVYFLPDRQHVTAAELVQLGLGHAFGQQSGASPQAAFTTREVYQGPEGKTGLVVSTDDGALAYKPDVQTWRKHWADPYWCGYWNESPPTPDELQRPVLIDGVPLVLEDGRTWLAPRAREFHDMDGQLLADTPLPRKFECVEGVWVPGEVKQPWRKLWDLALAFTETVASDDDGSTLQFRFDDADQLAILCLQTNYRVAALEVDQLGIYSEQVRHALIRVACDLDGFAEILKKNAAAGTVSKPGPSESNTDTAPDGTDQP